ncbi:hypothetical protein [Rufibacter quisquiliarum]|uniref:Uncharacterized protein n=1 Tax=Rufibacter quisquiliarum TaxID=1549639 RepID=A0A839GP07_9BACT|nr:hypothetical protein [Rufibacter quisquiliarum]MBA9077265.1 hypothetical protein [Rufibacter quisquiliarum]
MEAGTLRHTFTMGNISGQLQLTPKHLQQPQTWPSQQKPFLLTNKKAPPEQAGLFY